MHTVAPFAVPHYLLPSSGNADRLQDVFLTSLRQGGSNMPDRKGVIVTGGAGLIGSILSEGLGDYFDLTSYDLREAAGAKSVIGDLGDLGALTRAFEGQDAAVHLAADRSASAAWDSALQHNFIGTYNVFEAAKRAGVKRVVFASSNHATGGFYLVEPWKHICEGRFDLLEEGKYPLVDESYRIRPDGYYGVSKAFGEALGSYYNDYHGVGSIHLRIGWVLAGDDPAFSPFALSLWLSHRDIAQIVRKSLEAPDSLDYGVFYATSDNTWKIFDISRAKTVLGYAPEDRAGSEFTKGPVPARDR
jgi:nucleoside-diphosphate-sugar epimerase